MLVLWMGYTVLLGVVVVGAAALVERGVPGRRRWLWAGAQLLVVGLPLVRPVLRALGGASSSLDVVFGPIVPVVRGALPDLGAAAAASPALADLRAPAVVIWIAASLVLMVLVLGGMLRTRRLRRGWRAHTLDGSEVLVSDDLGPAVVGVRRPAIVLPKWVLDLPPSERALVLAHEEEHRRSGDPALLAAALLAPVLLPWNPAAWIAFVRLREAVETDCDRRVLAGVGRKPVHYARLLFDVSTRSRAAIPLGAGFGERASTLERRIRTILETRLHFGWRGLAVRLSVAAVLLTAACSLEVNIYADGTRKGGSDEAPTTDARSPEPALRIDGRGGAKEEVVIPAKPPVVARPTPEEEGGAARPKEEIAAGPTFTPFTVAPAITNREEVVRAMEKEYPPLLREAGIGGTVKVYFFIDETGRVQDVRVDQSSGHQALDEAALRVADIYRFTPALNRDQKVPVWVSFPITFQVR